MASNEGCKSVPERTWRPRVPRFCVVAVPLVALLLWGCGSTPQLGSEECLGAADGLWTAVTAQDIQFIDTSAKVIEQLHVDGKMADDSFEILTGVIASASRPVGQGAQRLEAVRTRTTTAGKDLVVWRIAIRIGHQKRRGSAAVRLPTLLTGLNSAPPIAVAVRALAVAALDPAASSVPASIVASGPCQSAPTRAPRPE